MNTTTDHTLTGSPATVTPCAATRAVDQYDHVAAADYLMKHAGTVALAVLDGQRADRPLGCITAADIAEAVAAGTDLNQTRIRDLIIGS